MQPSYAAPPRHTQCNEPDPQHDLATPTTAAHIPSPHHDTKEYPVEMYNFEFLTINSFSGLF
jgi:hypothetical protein